MLTLFIDTNVLLQYHSLVTLNWLALDSDGVRVVISVAALAEIDRAKASGNTRRAKKAREVSSMFSAALDDGTGSTAIPGSSNCTWEFASGDTLWHDSLDRDLSDHRLIAEALHLAAVDESVAFMTGDTLARLSASRVGLRVVKVPSDWLLAPESDGHDKRLRELESRVAAMEKAAPSIVVALKRNDAHSTSLHEEFQFFEQPIEQVLDELIAVLQKRYPCATSCDREEPCPSAFTLGTIREVPTEEHFQTYRDVHYPHWLWQSRRILLCLADRWSRANGLLREFGFAIPLGADQLRPAVLAALEDGDNELPMALRHALTEVLEEIEAGEAAMAAIEQALTEIVRDDTRSQRLMQAGGVGLLTATAMSAGLGDLARFRSGRHLASTLGPTPRLSSAPWRLGTIGPVVPRVEHLQSWPVLPHEERRKRCRSRPSAGSHPALGAGAGRTQGPQQGRRRPGQQDRATTLGRRTPRRQLRSRPHQPAPARLTW